MMMCHPLRPACVLLAVTVNLWTSSKGSALLQRRTPSRTVVKLPRQHAVKCAALSVVLRKASTVAVLALTGLTSFSGAGRSAEDAAGCGRSATTAGSLAETDPKREVSSRAWILPFVTSR